MRHFATIFMAGRELESENIRLAVIRDYKGDALGVFSGRDSLGVFPTILIYISDESVDRVRRAAAAFELEMLK
jgi:hypothetical protein